MTAEVIVFPKVAKAKVTQEAKEALKLQAKRDAVEASLNIILGSDKWDMYTFLPNDLEMLALFGETMRFDPKVSSRLISKLAEFIARLSRALQNLEEGPCE